MPIIFRAPAVPPELLKPLREAADVALEGDWRITVLQSHLDGQWNVRVEGGDTNCRIVLSSLDNVTVSGLATILRHLSRD
jgi:hypothetical protein